MLKTNWSHVVAQKPPPTWPVIPRDFTIPWAVENSTKQTPWSEKAFSVNLTFILGEGRWPESQSNSNGWQWMDDSCPFLMICFIHSWKDDWRSVNLCEGSKVYWRTSFWNSSILKSSGCAMGHRSYCASIDPLSHIPSQTVWENFRNPNFHFGGIWTLTTKTWCKLIQPCNYNYHRA